ncbi:MAG: capsule polysaccharide export protein KpsE/RkpR, partial [Cognaticolwellia sp.]
MSNFSHLSVNNKLPEKQVDAGLDNDLGQASVAAINQYLQLAVEQKLD